MFYLSLLRLAMIFLLSMLYSSTLPFLITSINYLSKSFSLSPSYFFLIYLSLIAYYLFYLPFRLLSVLNLELASWVCSCSYFWASLSASLLGVLNENILLRIAEALMELTSIPCFLIINSSIFYFLMVFFWLCSFFSLTINRLLLLDWFNLD